MSTFDETPEDRWRLVLNFVGCTVALGLFIVFFLFYGADLFSLLRLLFNPPQWS